MAKDVAAKAEAVKLGQPIAELVSGYTYTPTLDAVVSITKSAIMAGQLRPDAVVQFMADVKVAVTAILDGGSQEPVEPVEEVEKPTASQIRKSITPDHLISFIDGQKYKTLKRHLTKHGLTIETYREKYGLPMDYPSVSANYSAQRSQLAKTLGLGQREAAEETGAA